MESYKNTKITAKDWRFVKKIEHYLKKKGNEISITCGDAKSNKGEIIDAKYFIIKKEGKCKNLPFESLFIVNEDKSYIEGENIKNPLLLELKNFGFDKEEILDIIECAITNPEFIKIDNDEMNCLTSKKIKELFRNAARNKLNKFSMSEIKGSVTYPVFNKIKYTGYIYTFENNDINGNINVKFFENGRIKVHTFINNIDTKINNLFTEIDVYNYLANILLEENYFKNIFLN